MSSTATIGRRRLVSALAIAIASRPWVAGAQPARIPRVGILGVGYSAEPASLQREPFERGLRELGWTPGTTIVLEYRYAEGHTERLEYDHFVVGHQDNTLFWRLLWHARILPQDDPMLRKC